MRKTKLLAVLMTLSFLTISPALAQTAPTNQPAQPNTQNQTSSQKAKSNFPIISNQPAITSPANCFDYYHFQSVQVSVGTDKDAYKPGDTIHFHGNLINQNNYPVVDGNVFARIGRKDPKYVTEGNFIIDELVPLQDISLAANETKPVSFDWTVPSGVTNGDYRIDYFFSVGKKYNLGGLPFTNEIVVGGTWFTINSSNVAYVSFDRSGATVNGNHYSQIGNWPIIKPNDQADVTQLLDNTYSTPQTATIQYDLYFWDSLNPADKISSKTDQVTIPANGSIPLTYTVPQMKDSVYLLKITATTASQKSIVNIRLTSDQAHPKMNYPAITKFPLQKGDQETLFSCFYNAAPSNASGTLSVVLQDQKGNQIGDLEYSGGISGAMMADKQDFTAKGDYSWIKLIATLKDKNGQVTDQYENVYDCAKINSPACKALLAREKTQMTGLAAAFGQRGISTFKEIIIGIIIALVLISLIIIVWKKRTGRMIKTLTLLAIGGSLFLTVPKTEAYNGQSNTVSTSWNFVAPYATNTRFWGSSSIENDVEMTTGGLAVTSGDPINFSYNADNNLPTFNSSGSWSDSPNGIWCPDLSSSSCAGKVIPSPNGGPWLYLFTGDWPTYGTVTAVKPTNISITPTDPVTDNPSNAITCSGLNCTAQNVATPTSVTLTANIPAISGAFWNGIATSEAYATCSDGSKVKYSGLYDLLDSDYNYTSAQYSLCGETNCGAWSVCICAADCKKPADVYSWYNIDANQTPQPLTFPASKVSWTVTVNPATSVNGACDPTAINNGSPFAQGTSSYPTGSTFCSAGTCSYNGGACPPAFPTTASPSVSWTCQGSAGTTPTTCSANLAGACTHDQTCASHDITWSGTCSPGGCGPSNTESGTCVDDCGTTQTVNEPCPVPCCTCTASDEAAHCNGEAYTNNCGNSCAGTKDCSYHGWREVAP